ncbi:substrate-binding periplasmic protein [Atopomonas sediminilitoris]|uniref:substrate-binding periplasmic protein n=1 Tax=Atopomonas sediminilitoris TaxID=2919919 RepID=UPI001F4D834D|nr:transporter substrate-binding domain-containing protein [Atopomonas sediminilitoris]MCJ8168252.1 transporter substrate-binding domain-containing protein [Atopomonas sediminilitoris]
MRSFGWLFLLAMSSVVAGEYEADIAIGEWPPFIGSALPGYGPVVQVINEAYAEVGVRTRLGFYPWKRSLQMARQGKWLATAVWGLTPKRERAFYYSRVVFSDELVLVTRSSWPVQVSSLGRDYELLCNKRIAVALGSEVLEDVQQLQAQGCLTLISVPDESTGLEMILKKRVDALYVNRRSAVQALEGLSLEQQQALRIGQAIGRWDYYVLFSRAREDGNRLRDLFDAGLNKLEERGRLQELLEPLQPN